MSQSPARERLRQAAMRLLDRYMPVVLVRCDCGASGASTLFIRVDATAASNSEEVRRKQVTSAFATRPNPQIKC